MSDPWPTAFITLKYSTQCVLDSSELGAAITTLLHELPKQSDSIKGQCRLVGIVQPLCNITASFPRFNTSDTKNPLTLESVGAVLIHISAPKLDGPYGLDEHHDIPIIITAIIALLTSMKFKVDPKNVFVQPAEFFTLDSQYSSEKGPHLSKGVMELLLKLGNPMSSVVSELSLAQVQLEIAETKLQLAESTHKNQRLQHEKEMCDMRQNLDKMSEELEQLKQRNHQLERKTSSKKK